MLITVWRQSDKEMGSGGLNTLIKKNKKCILLKFECRKNKGCGPQPSFRNLEKAEIKGRTRKCPTIICEIIWGRLKVFFISFHPKRLSFCGSFFMKHEGGDTHDSETFNNEIMEYGIIKYALS